MAQRDEELERLVRELAQLGPLEQARVVARATRLRRGATAPAKFAPPTLRGGRGWIGGDLRRETMYDDDGR